MAVLRGLLVNKKQNTSFLPTLTTAFAALVFHVPVKQNVKMQTFFCKVPPCLMCMWAGTAVTVRASSEHFWMWASVGLMLLQAAGQLIAMNCMWLVRAQMCFLFRFSRTTKKEWKNHNPIVTEPGSKNNHTREGFERELHNVLHAAGTQ